MGIKTRRKVVRIGHSKGITLPPVVKGDEATIAADRLVLVDPRGEISEDDLLKFLEEYVEPYFWEWIRKRRGDGDEHTA